MVQEVETVQKLYNSSSVCEVILCVFDFFQQHTVNATVATTVTRLTLRSHRVVMFVHKNTECTHSIVEKGKEIVFFIRLASTRRFSIPGLASAPPPMLLWKFVWQQTCFERLLSPI